MVDAVHREPAMKLVPCATFIRINLSAPSDPGANEVERRDLGSEHAGEPLAVALANHDHDLTLTGLVLPESVIPTVLAPIGGLHVTTKIAAIDLCPFALAAHSCLPNLGSHRFAHFVSQHESRHVVRPEIAGQRQHALAFDFIAEDRDGEQVGAERHLARMKERSARNRETVSACLTPPASCSIGAAAVINDRAAAFRAKRIAAIAGPADLAEDGLGLLIRHARDGR
jgi:hypothetical protein